MILYTFSIDEWLKLYRCFDLYRLHIPVFLSEALNCYFVKHLENRTIDNKDELEIIILFIETLTYENVHREKNVKSKDDVRIERLDYSCDDDWLLNMLSVLNAINLNCIRDYGKEEERTWI